MKRELKSLLRKLEAIEEDYDGLGATDVREHMGEHIRRAFLKPEPGFVPRGEYGLEPAANRKVATALAAFCKAASIAAERDGLTTFEQRVTAFQDPDVETASGAHFNDYFGVIEFDKKGSKGKKTVVRPTKKDNAGLQALVFERNGTLDELCEALNAAGDWQWFVTRQYRVPFMETHPGNWLWGKIRAVKPSGHGFIALLETEAEAETGVDELVAAFRGTLGNAKITAIAAVDASSG